MTRAKYDRLWKEYKRAQGDVVSWAVVWAMAQGRGRTEHAEGSLLGAVMKYKLLSSELPKFGEVIS